MQYRSHRAVLADSLATCVEIDGTMSGLRSHIGDLDGMLYSESIFVQEYSGEDRRIGWDATFIVMGRWKDGVVAPVGFTDEMPT